MDMDTTGGKDGHTRILEKFAGHEADILVGTQMIVKGHDFPDVTLVGVLAADMSLYAGSYMASERTFQLLVQAVGRAGRGKHIRRNITVYRQHQSRIMKSSTIRRFSTGHCLIILRYVICCS